MFRSRLFKLSLTLLVISALFLGAMPAPAQQLPSTWRHYAPLVLSNPEAAVSLKLSEQLRWIDPASQARSYDLVIVADYSGAMRQCFATNSDCNAPNRRIDYQTPEIRKLVSALLETRNTQGDDHRLGFVTFGHSSAGKNIAKTHVTFTMSNELALTTFKAAIGNAAQPRMIPDAELTGAASIPAALQMARDLFDSAPRTVDRDGRPVQRAILLLTSQVANVFVDAPVAGVVNSQTADPFHCQAASGDIGTSDPQTQYTCPAPNHPQNTTGVRPPLRAAVEIADAARASRQIEFFAIGLGGLSGLTAEHLRLNLIAPTHYGKAATPSAFAAQMAAVLNTIGATCQARVASPIAAAGAQVRLFNSGGSLAYSGVTDGEGRIATRLPLGAYSLRASHTNVVAPADPTLTPRTYDKLITDWLPTPVSSAPLTITVPLSGGLALPASVLLTINDPATVQCPQAP